MNTEEALEYILDRHATVLEGGKKFPSPERTFNRYAVSIFRGGVGKTTLTFNLAYEMAKKDELLVIDVCPQRNLSELLLGEDLNDDGDDIYKALLPTVLSGFPPPESGVLSQRISQSCKDFRKGKKSFVIPGSNSLYLFASSLYSALSGLAVVDPSLQKEGTKRILLGFKDFLDRETEKLGVKKILIDTSPFFGGASHLAWLAAEALIVPVRVDKSSIEAFKLTIKMLKDPTMDFLRYANSGGIDDTPKIHVIAITHCGWSRIKARTPDRSTQAFVSQVIDIISSEPELFSSSNPLDSIVLLDDFHSSGRISGATRRPLAELKVRQFVNVEGKRLQVNESLDRYQRELRFLTNML